MVKVNERRIATWNINTLYRSGALNELVKEMEKYKIDGYAHQKIRWPGKGTVIKRNTGVPGGMCQTLQECSLR